MRRHARLGAEGRDGMARPLVFCQQDLSRNLTGI